MKILLVDNEPIWIEFIKSILGSLVDVSTTVSKGYDLIILSANMLDKIKDAKDNFIVATSQPTTQEAIKSYRLGAKDYFTKDFREIEIHKIVMKNIRRNHE